MIDLCCGRVKLFLKQIYQYYIPALSQCNFIPMLSSIIPRQKIQYNYIIVVCK